MTETDQNLERRVTETLRTMVDQLPPIRMTIDRNAGPLSPIELPKQRRSRIFVAATVALVVLFAAVALAIVVRRDDGSDPQPAGPARSHVVARIELVTLPSLSFQAKELTTVAGRNRITLTGRGGSETLVFDDPALAQFSVSTPTGPSVGTVNLEAGKDYRIHSVIPGHTKAGVEAVIHVLPAGARGNPPLPRSVLDLVSRAARSSKGAAHGVAEYANAGRNAANQALLDAEIPRDDQPVYVFVLRGSFVNDHARGGDLFGPTPSPRGSILTLTITRTAPPEILDYGLGSTTSNLSRVGGAISTKY